MPDNVDEQLVQQIVEQVLEAVRREQAQQPAHARSGSAPTGHARVRPPAGVCTGDYSKFKELAGRPVGAPSPTAPRTGASALDQANAADAAGAGPRSPLALTGIITAQQLQAAIDAAPDGVARLAQDARLTPLANDFVRQHPEKVRRVGRELSSAPASSNRASGAGGVARHDAMPWLWWTDGHVPAAQALAARLGARVRPSAAPRGDSGLAQVIADLAGAVEAGNVQGGLLFVHSAARAACFANRCRSLRAVVGTCPESVEQAIRELGANVLIVEYSYVDAQAIEAMVEQMMQSQPTPPADVRRHLNELPRGR